MMRHIFLYIFVLNVHQFDLYRRDDRCGIVTGRCHHEGMYWCYRSKFEYTIDCITGTVCDLDISVLEKMRFFLSMGCGK